jgi:general secretion pathway protein L
MDWKFTAWWDRFSAEFLSEAGSLGVFLDRAGLTLAHVKKSLLGVQAQHILHLPLSAGSLEDLGPPLKEAVSQWGLEGCPASLAVASEMAFFRPATLPRAAGENLSQVVAYELDRFLPLPAERLYYAFQVVKETETEIHLLLLALPREPVEECLQLLTEANLRPVSVEPAPGAVANAFALLAKRLPSSWLLINLAPEGLEFTTIRGKILAAWRRVGLTPAQDPAAALLLEVQRLEAEGPEVKALCLYGRGSPHLEAAALDRLGEKDLITPELFNLQGMAPDSDQATVLPAVGAALRGLGKVPLGANLLPPEARPALRLGSYSLPKLLLAVFLGLFCIWTGSLLIHKRVMLYQVNSQVAQLAPEARRVERQLEESKALAQQLKSFRRLGESPDKLRILKDLTQLIPDHTWLFQLRISQQTLEISGMSKSAADLIPLLEKSGWLTKTEFASPIVADARKLEHFKIKAEIKGLEP